MNARAEKNLRQEYDHLRHSVWSRGQTAWLVHSIIVSSSLIAVLESWKYHEKFNQPLPIFNVPLGIVFPMAAIIGMLFSIFLQYTDLRLNDVMFRRMHEIENQLEMVGPTEMFETGIKPKSWYKIRRLSWFVLFIFLAFVYLMILVEWLIA